MKINACIIFCCVLLLRCGEAGIPASSYIHSVADTLPIDKTKNILIYTINPNDCISCINGFKLMNTTISGSTHPCVYVICVDREIEKNELKKKIKDIDLEDSENKAVLWNKEIFEGINHSSYMTRVIVYNYTADSVIYSKPVREVINVEEVKTNLEKVL